jgi:glycosyltransferase involved in cell wall biosynthesis
MNAQIATHSLFISYDGLTDPLGRSQILPYLLGLRQEGFEISIISFEKPDRLKMYKQDIEAIVNNAQIAWHPLPYTKRPPVLATLYDIWQMNKATKAIHKAKPIDIIHCRSYISALIGLGFKQKHGTKFLFDMRGYWADERVDGKIWDIKKPLYKWIYNYFKKREIAFLENVDHIIVLTHASKAELLARKNLNIKCDITVIPCCVDIGHFNTKALNADKLMRIKQGLTLLPKHELMIYVGSIGTWYMLPEMLLFYKALIENKPNVQFLFLTTEPIELIAAACKKIDLSMDKILVQSASRDEVPYFISLANYSIFFILPAFSKTASSPTKQGEVMAMGKPIICNNMVGDTAYVIEHYNAGIVCTNFDFDYLKKMTLSFDYLKFDALNITKGANEFYGLKQGVANYKMAYKALTKK